MYILSYLFINVSGIISYVSLSGNVFRENPISTKSSFGRKVSFGLGGSFTTIILMYFSYMIPGTYMFIDLRYFPLIFVFYYGGIVPTLVAGSVVIIYLLGFWNINNSTIIASINIILYIMSYYIIKRVKANKSLEVSSYYIFSLLIYIISLFSQINNVNQFFNIFMIYTIVSLVTYILMFFLISRNEISNNLYRKYKEESSKDFLTGLYNTRQYDNLYNSIIKNIVLNSDELAYLLIDVDFFKLVNDNYGHDIGDKILCQLAEVIKTSCKTTEIISRIGGEEFCVLSLGSNLEDAVKLAESLRESIEIYHFYISEVEYIHITVSIGLSIYPHSTKNINSLKSLADQALYISKHNGRNRVSYL